LFVGGEFTQAGTNPVANVARWTGSNWDYLGGGVNGAVRALEAVGHFAGDTSPDIYVGGDFTIATNFTMATNVNHIAKWSGTNSSWSSLGSGVSSAGFSEPYDSNLVTVCSLRNIGGFLWAGGRFSTAGGVSSPNIAQWNLNTLQWSGLGSHTTYCGGSQTTIGPGINSPLVMVTAIDPGGQAIVLCTNNVPPPPDQQINPADYEGFYTFNGSVFSGQCRTPNMRAVSVVATTDMFAGHDQILYSQFYPVTELALAEYSGVTELVSGTWRLLGGGGTALPPTNGSPWWPCYENGRQAL
jgi:hypothetical protein